MANGKLVEANAKVTLKIDCFIKHRYGSVSTTGTIKLSVEQHYKSFDVSEETRSLLT